VPGGLSFASASGRPSVRAILCHPGSHPIPAKPDSALLRAPAAGASPALPHRPASPDGDALLDALPDLALLVGRDGVLLAQGGGRDAGLRPRAGGTGRPLEASWPAPVATLLKQLTRKAIAQRATAEARFASDGAEYGAQSWPRGPDRAVCIIRRLGCCAADDRESAPQASVRLDRRGFLRRFKESTAWAAMRETPLALAVIHLDGVADIAQVLASRLSEQVTSAAIRRLPAPPQAADSQGAEPPWYLGQLSDSLLAVVFEGGAERDPIEACVARICASLRQPVHAGDAEFHLTPCAGVAILGRDAATPKLLLEQARAAAMEARRGAAAQEIRFFSDTMRLRALARIDLTRELRDAIAAGDIRLRYTGRHDLRTGRLTACVGYLRWQHPLRGEIRPAEFLALAAATGLATALSRAVLAHVREDFAVLAARCAPDVHVSFGALRHHILHEDFLGDVSRLIEEGGVPAERLEVRIAEKVFITRDSAQSRALGRLGVRLVVDEVARGMGSLDALARAPIWGLQLDRAWVAALRTDPVAGRVCRAAIEMAAALGLIAIGNGVDDAATRETLLAIGCAHGSGDLYRDAELDITPR